MSALLLAIALLQGPNTLTPDEVQQGWKLLFDGKTTQGWHNFKSKTIGPGWKVEDGILTSVDPATAGDIVTDEKFQWFELSLEFRLTKRGNSGVMFRVTDEGEQTWHSGPEIQIYDHVGDAPAEKTGWLYQLYSSPVDAARPPGEWNHLRLLVSPEKCRTHLNGTLYYEFVIDSPEFWKRVEESKFVRYPMFAKSKVGSIGIQGDHGVVSFRNVKIRPIQ